MDNKIVPDNILFGTPAGSLPAYLQYTPQAPMAPVQLPYGSTLADLMRSLNIQAQPMPQEQPQAPAKTPAPKAATKPKSSGGGKYLVSDGVPEQAPVAAPAAQPTMLPPEIARQQPLAPLTVCSNGQCFDPMFNQMLGAANQDGPVSPAEQMGRMAARAGAWRRTQGYDEATLGMAMNDPSTQARAQWYQMQGASAPEAAMLAARDYTGVNDAGVSLRSSPTWGPLSQNAAERSRDFAAVAGQDPRLTDGSVPYITAGNALTLGNAATQNKDRASAISGLNILDPKGNLALVANSKANVKQDEMDTRLRNQIIIEKVRAELRAKNSDEALIRAANQHAQLVARQNKSTPPLITTGEQAAEYIATQQQAGTGAAKSGVDVK